jgi:hypothetical protein
MSTNVYIYKSYEAFKTIESITLSKFWAKCIFKGFFFLICEVGELVIIHNKT